MAEFASVVRRFSAFLAQTPMNQAQRMALTNEIYKDSILSFNFAILLLSSAAIATFGLLENNAAVIIGAMIIAPLVLPIQSLALSAVKGDAKVFRNGALMILCGTAAAILLAGILSLVAGIPDYGSEIVARSKPTLLDLAIAVAAGGVGGFARVRPAIAATLAGTAIAVALMPPLCVIGIALAHGDGRLAYGSTLLYGANLIGITLASMVVYQIAGLGVRRNAHRAIVTALVFLLILGVPLGAGFFALVREARVEFTLKHELLTNTQTFHRVGLVKMDFDWLTTPPQVTLLVRSADPITPSQVEALEDFARDKTGRSFKLVFEVTPLVEVTGSADPSQ